MPRKKHDDTQTHTDGVPESKADRFRRLANARLAKLEAAGKAVAALASKASYEYTEEQAGKVIGVACRVEDNVREAFASGKVLLPRVEYV